MSCFASCNCVVRFCLHRDSFAAIDLVHKSIATAEFHHARTPLVALMMFALIAALVVFVPRVPSNAAAIGAGVACGGALGNLISLLRLGAGCA